MGGPLLTWCFLVVCKFPLGFLLFLVFSTLDLFQLFVRGESLRILFFGFPLSSKTWLVLFAVAFAPLLAHAGGGGPPSVPVPVTQGSCGTQGEVKVSEDPSLQYPRGHCHLGPRGRFVSMQKCFELSFLSFFFFAFILFFSSAR